MNVFAVDLSNEYYSGVGAFTTEHLIDINKKIK